MAKERWIAAPEERLFRHVEHDRVAEHSEDVADRRVRGDGPDGDVPPDDG